MTIRIIAKKTLVTFRPAPFYNEWKAFEHMCLCLFEGCQDVIVYDNSLHRVTKIETYHGHYRMRRDVTCISLQPFELLDTYTQDVK